MIKHFTFRSDEILNLILDAFNIEYVGLSTDINHIANAMLKDTVVANGVFMPKWNKCDLGDFGVSDEINDLDVDFLMSIITDLDDSIKLFKETMVRFINEPYLLGDFERQELQSQYDACQTIHNTYETTYRDLVELGLGYATESKLAMDIYEYIYNSYVLCNNAINYLKVLEKTETNMSKVSMYAHEFKICYLDFRAFVFDRSSSIYGSQLYDEIKVFMEELYEYAKSLKYTHFTIVSVKILSSDNNTAMYTIRVAT